MPIREINLLRDRNVAALTFSQAISQLGDRINNMAILGLLGIHAAGSSEYGFLAFWTVIPVAIFGPIAGAIADRFNRKHLMILADVMRGLIVLSLPFLFKMSKEMLVVYASVFAVFTFTVLFNSAKNGVVVHVAGSRDRIAVINGLMSFWGRIATGLGILFGGIISDQNLWRGRGFEGWEVGLVVDAVTFFASAFLILFIAASGEYIKPDNRDAKIDYWSALKSAAAFIKRRKILLHSLTAAALISLVGGATYILGIVKLQKIGQTTTGQLGVAGGIYGLGLFIGSYLAGRILPGREYKFLWRSIIVLALSLFGMALTVNLWLLLPIAAVGGVATSIGFIALDSIFQKYSSAEYIGRVVILKDVVNALTFTSTVLVLGKWNDILASRIGFESALNYNLIGVGLLVLLFLLVRRFVNG